MEEVGDALAMKDKVAKLEKELSGVAELRQQLADLQRILLSKNNSQV